jgi:hypothetical protein
MSRPWRLLALAVLLLAAAAVVIAALRPAPTPPPVAQIPTSGASATIGDQVWVWVGTGQCPALSGDTTSTIEHYDGSAWTSAAVPLAQVDAITFSDARHGLATGLAPDCHHEVIATTDAGVTWQPISAPALADVSAPGLTVWGIEATNGPRAVQRLRWRSDALVSAPGGRPTNPCNTRAGPPTQVAGVDDRTAMLVCQNVGIDERQVDRTASSGEAWQTVVDQRPETGFDGSGVTVTQLVAYGPRDAWALFADPQGECPEGQVRQSTDGGLSWDRLPCPSESVDVSEVFDVSYSSPTNAVMVGLRHDVPTVFVTSDGGQVWRPAASQPTW